MFFLNSECIQANSTLRWWLVRWTATPSLVGVYVEYSIEWLHFVYDHKPSSLTRTTNLFGFSRPILLESLTRQPPFAQASKNRDRQECDGLHEEHSLEILSAAGTVSKVFDISLQHWRSMFKFQIGIRALCRTHYYFSRRIVDASSIYLFLSIDASIFQGRFRIIPFSCANLHPIFRPPTLHVFSLYGLHKKVK